MEYVSHVIDENGLSFSREKIDDVLATPKPQTHKQMKSFLGKLIWTHETDNCFSELLKKVNSCPKLFFMDERSLYIS